jgi:hypothetical protein
MNLEKGFLSIIMTIGIILLVVYFITNNTMKSCEEKIIYKYIPRTLSEKQENPQFVSQIFKSMFTQPSVWINYSDENWQRKQEPLNRYVISQS